MNVSPAYAKEYRDWMVLHYQDVYKWALEGLPEALKLQHPALMDMNLDSIALCYCTRGAVALLGSDMNGWRDIQTGYWASVYKLRFELKSVTLPAWFEGRVFPGESQVELVLTLGLAKLFQQGSDISWLLLAIDTHFDSNAALGIDIDDGTLMLEAISCCINTGAKLLSSSRRDA